MFLNLINRREFFDKNYVGMTMKLIKQTYELVT
ncbi:hypothetical protein CPS_4303 [Colwellia psychrerythraea 34H]|uniref:Uncharacterized protein n=1 Tax=Colwellia psychrerythraea (strain 34H / ATCC BAA-681) TaxID=167879 RepID=Q47W69_COLP3|nr:hypothetical protein CPS_4303 [Colwellia psychrerythraea 34H]